VGDHRSRAASSRRRLTVRFCLGALLAVAVLGGCSRERPQEEPAPAETTTTTAEQAPLPVVPPAGYGWCPAWEEVTAAAERYTVASERVAAASAAIAETVRSLEAEDEPVDHDKAAQEWITVAEEAAAGLVEYSDASAAAAQAAEDAYRAVASASDAAVESLAQWWQPMAQARADGDAEAWTEAARHVEAARQALNAAQDGSSDPDIMGDLTIGTSGWEAGVWFDWPAGWPAGRHAADRLQAAGDLCAATPENPMQSPDPQPSSTTVPLPAE